MFNAILKIFGLGSKESCSCSGSVKVTPSNRGVEDLQNFVAYVAKSLVDYPDEVSVATENGEERMTIRIDCRKTDKGKIVGKRGKTISAIRALTAGAAGRLQQKINVEVVD